jgi:PAS domain S-box-containing protein
MSAALALLLAAALAAIAALAVALHRLRRTLADTTIRLGATFEQAAVGMAQASPDGRWVRVNQRLCDMLGYTEAELLARTWRDITHPDDIAADTEGVRRILAGHATTFAHRKRYLRRDGTVCHAELSVAAQRAPDGRLLHTLAVIQDISARVAAEQAGAEAQARLRTIVETVPVGLVLAELPSGRILGANTHVETLLRHPVRLSPDLASHEEWVAFHADGSRVRSDEFPLARMALAGEENPELEVLFRRGDATSAWVRILGRPVRDEAGRLTGGVVAMVDVDREHRAVEALAESEARFRSFAEQAPDVIYVIDVASRRVDYVSPASEAVWGEAPEAMMQPGRWEALLHPDDRAAALASEANFYTTREPLRFEYRIVRRDGDVRYIRDTAVPVRDAAGRVVRVIGIARDATERHRAEARLQASEERLSLASTAARLGIWDSDTDTGEAVVNAEFRALYGLAPGDGTVARETWLALLHPEDRPRMEAAMRDYRPGSSYREEFRILRADTGELRWIASRGSSVAPRPGARSRFVGVCYDITARRTDQERQALLAREVDHRARNVLAVVQSILRLTRAEDPRRYVEAVEGRVAALARAHTLLSRDRWTGADVGDVLREELSAYRGAARVGLSGPPVRLRPEAVQPLSMVLHELVTNAAKYGALSMPGGALDVTWELAAGEEKGRLRLHWIEQGGPAIPGPPARGGFGSLLITATLRDQLRGGAHLDWRPQGLSCTITLPADTIAPGAPPPQPAPRAAPEPPPAPLYGRRVLLVEDEPLIRLLMESTLTRLGCTIVGPAGTLAEARRLAERGPAGLDAAVLDVNLHGEPSYQLAESLAARGVKVIFVTGYGDLPDHLAGLGPLLRKPIEEDALAAALHLVLARATVA